VRHYDHSSTAEHPQAKAILIALSRIGPSVFLLLFAAIIGRLAHTVLLWRLEKGARIGLLDTLAGSTSLTSTVTSQIQLRTISILGFGIVLLWLLLPLGGQAQSGSLALVMALLSRHLILPIFSRGQPAVCTEPAISG
jgi:hypothetical protein